MIDHGNLKLNLTIPCTISVKLAYCVALYVFSLLRLLYSLLNKDISYFVPACCVLQNDSTVNVDSLMGRYSFAATAGKMKLRGEIALWRQKWIRLKNDSNVVPETAVAALEACDKTTFPLIYTFLSILVTLPVSTASAEKSFSTLRRVKTWLYLELQKTG